MGRGRGWPHSGHGGMAAQRAGARARCDGVGRRRRRRARSWWSAVPTNPIPPRHIRTGTGLAASTSVPGLGSPLPHLHRDWARPCHICTGTGLAPATCAPGLGSPLPRLHRDWACRCHVCASFSTHRSAETRRRGCAGSSTLLSALWVPYEHHPRPHAGPPGHVRARVRRLRFGCIPFLAHARPRQATILWAYTRTRAVCFCLRRASASQRDNHASE
jgi:hypothetical protein